MTQGGGIHLPEFAAPKIEIRFRKAMLRAQVCDWNSAVGCLRKVDDWLLGEPLIQVQPLPWGSWTLSRLA